jgi:hypothetical protein
VQRPYEKPNHALVLGGEPGIGKDALIDPVRSAIGEWNFADISPAQLIGRFNKFARSVIIRVSEARDLGDFDRYEFYEHTKRYAAAPPEMLYVDEKSKGEYYVPNLCGLIITTNYLSGGIYLPAEDRRHYVAWSEVKAMDLGDGYFKALYDFYANGGRQHVAAYMASLDLSKFDPHAPPPKTAAFWTIVDANRSAEDGEIAEVIEKLGNPEVVPVCDVREAASWDGKLGKLLDDGNPKVTHLFERTGYTKVVNIDAKDGKWVVNVFTRDLRVGIKWDATKKRSPVYGRKDIAPRGRLAAAGALADRAQPAGLS